MRESFKFYRKSESLRFGLHLFIAFSLMGIGNANEHGLYSYPIFCVCNFDHMSNKSLYSSIRFNIIFEISDFLKIFPGLEASTYSSRDHVTL